MRFGFSLLLALLLASPGYALSVGDKAPPVAADAWFNGPAVNPAEPDGKTTYIVEFWATWCPPCKKSIPHLNELQDRFAGQGVVIVGVSAEVPKTVEPFLKKMKMRYRVAIDTNGANESTYMEGVRGIPYAFIVDKNGVVAWSGHPLDNMDETLTEVLAGTYRMEEIRGVREKEQELQRLLMDQDFKGALKTVDKLIALDPKKFDYYEMKLGLLGQTRRPDQVKPLFAQTFKACQDSAKDLNTLAWMAATSPFMICDLELAWKAATRAAELSGRKESVVLDTLARVHYAAGAINEAMAIQQEALGVASNDEERDDLQATLNYYRSAAALRELIIKETEPRKESP
jgi:thiol-disulfide isomerase/thioredoxin